MATSDATIKLLYQVFSQRFKVSELQQGIDRPVKLALLGRPEPTAQLREVLLTGSPRVESIEKIVVCLDVASDWTLRLADMNAVIVVVDEAGVQASLFDQVRQRLPKDLPHLVLCHGPFRHSVRLEAREIQTEMGLRPFYFVGDLTVDDIRPVLSTWAGELEPVALPLGRRLVFWRKGVARHFITKVSRQNFAIALASAIPSTIPIIGFLASTLAAAGEMVVMTANQLKLCLQIAGMYGLEINFWERMQELLPVVGSGIGFRQLSRTAVGLIPVAGPAIKATVAYSGTWAVGESARWFYESGRKLSAHEYRQILSRARREALAQAKQSVRRIGRKRPSQPPPTPHDDVDGDKT
ncbi:MAG TPA: hypothetical protein VGO93_12085 [Candidatus Xenobia bacterium]